MISRSHLLSGPSFLSQLRRSRPVAALVLCAMVLAIAPKPAFAQATPAVASSTTTTSATTTAATTSTSAAAVTPQDSALPTLPTSTGAWAMDAKELASSDPTSGVAQSSVTFESPAARGIPQPDLSLAYNAASGDSLAGVGWSLSSPTIERRPVSGNGFEMLSSGTATPPTTAQIQAAERFVFQGSELVEICTIIENGCPSGTSAAGEAMPSWVTANWRYFRLRDDGIYARFFLSPDENTWRVQFKDGQVFELGQPIVAAAASGTGLESDAFWVGCKSTVTSGVASYCAPAQFRWHLVRKFDLLGGAATPTNVVVYSWTAIGSALSGGAGLLYLSDAYDTPSGDITVTANYAHHLKLSWGAPSYPAPTNQAIWHSRPDQRLIGVDVTSAQSGTTRQLVRRYHLGYTEDHMHSYLSSVQMEGRCATPPAEPIPATTGCQTSPAMTFQYSVAHYNYVPFQLKTDTPFTSKRIAVTDINADGLPDLVESLSTTQQRIHSNTSRGSPGFHAFTIPVYVTPNVSMADGTTLLGPKDVSIVGDFTGLGTPQVYWFSGQPTPSETGWPSYTAYNSQLAWSYVPQLVNGSWAWTQTITDSRWVPEWTYDITYQQFDGLDEREYVGDVDGDGLPDAVVVFATGAGAGIALSRRDPSGTYHPFSWSGGSWSLSCQSTGDFHDLADVNGDGLAEMYFVSKTGQVGYCPTQDQDTFGAAVSMGNVPPLAGVTSAFMHDLNGDGFADLIWTTSQGIGFAENEGGIEFATDPGWVKHFPGDQPWTNYTDGVGDPSTWQVFFADMNGNGVDDLVVFDGASVWYTDYTDSIPDGLANDQALSSPNPSAPRPGLLLEADNGLGAATQLTYMSSTDEMTIAEQNGDGWATKSPAVQSVVVRIVSTNGLPAPHAERRETDLIHRDAVYDGWNHSFVGFQHVQSIAVGDSTAPSQITDTTYLPGACADQTVGCQGDPTNELRGVIMLPTLIEKSDENGVYYSTTHITYDLEEPYTAADGSFTRSTAPNQTDTWLYEPAAQTPGPTQTTSDVQYHNDNPLLSSSFPIRAGTNAHIKTQQSTDMRTGNLAFHIDYGQLDATGASLDVAIRTVYSWALYSADNWAWRVHETTVGDTANNITRDVTYEYDAYGQVTDVHSPVTGTQTLYRYHQDPTQKLAPQPPNAAVEGSVVHLVQYGYDGYGNVTSETRPNGSCAGYQYTDSFNLFPEIETDGCGSSPFATIRTFDWGFGVMTGSSLPNGANTASSYDQLGRIVEAWGPDPFSGSPSRVLFSAVYASPTSTTPYSLVHLSTPAGEVYRYLDGFGQPFAAMRSADTSAGDPGPWLVSGMVDRNTLGGVHTQYEPWFYSGTPETFPASSVATSRSTSATYDGLGRPVVVTDVDGSQQSKRVYHALGTDFYTAADLDGSRTPVPSSVSYDGHGRTASAMAQMLQPSHDVMTTTWSYTTADQVSSVLQVHQLTSDTVQRTMTYDSLGRLVLNTEPNTSATNPSGNPTVLAWRYAYDNGGHLVGTSDARGCGKNLFYDSFGRESGEDYSPCLSSQEPYSAPQLDANNNLVNGTNAEVYFHYDTPETVSLPTPYVNASIIGKLVSVTDRGAHTEYAYDEAGRVVNVARQLPTPSTFSGAAGAVTYAPTWYGKQIQYDNANRIHRETTGANLSDLFDVQDTTDDGPLGGSAVVYAYSARGLLTGVTGSYGTLASGMTYDMRGLPTSVTLGDVAGTKEQFFYQDPKQRLSEHIVSRAKGPWLSLAGYTAPSDGSTLQGPILQDTYSYDSNNNPTTIADGRNAGDWQSGYEPVTRTLKYDDLGRMTSTTYSYPASTGDAQKPTTTNEWAVPQLPLASRVQSQSFSYDWLGNMSGSDDDQHALYDRSIGTTSTNVAGHPSQLASTTMAGSNGGSLGAQYDLTGNLVVLTLGRKCGGGAAPTCLSSEFYFTWDEVGQLVDAQRWDSNAREIWNHPQVDIKYTYSQGRRVLEQIQYNGDTTAADTLYTAEVFGTLRLNHAHFLAAGDYEQTDTTETAYLAGLARVVYAQNDPAGAASGARHIFYAIQDELGSTRAVIDRASSEVVESSSFQSFGARDSDFHPDRWGDFQEDYRFTGLSDDAEVGLTYAGARYYFAALRRFISPDPLTIHGVAGSLNPYSYSENSPLKYVDRTGLLAAGCYDYENCDGSGSSSSGSSTGGVQVGGSGAGDAIANAVHDIVSSIGSALSGLFSSGPPPPPAPTPRINVAPAPAPFHAFAQESWLSRTILTGDGTVARFLQDDAALGRLQNNIAYATAGTELALASGGAGDALAPAAGRLLTASTQFVRGAGSWFAQTAAAGAGASALASPAAQEIEEKLAEGGEAAAEEVEAASTAITKYWPANNGFVGTPTQTTLQPGTLIDRFGAETGTYTSPAGTPFAMRALPASALEAPYKVYQVLKALPVQAGTIAPAFGQIGQGIQYILPRSVGALLEDGYLGATE